MKKIGFIAFLLCSAWILRGQSVSVSSGQIKHFENVKSKFVASRNVDVWLPEGYNPKKKYAVLYMHDGQMLFDSTKNWNKQEWRVDETMSQLMQQKRIKNCIVVGIHNTKDRHAEYFPKKAFDSLPTYYREMMLSMSKQSPGMALFTTDIQSDAYLKFIVEELKPFVDKEFSTSKKRKNTFIAGSSMGGLISLYALCEYPSVFGGAACLSTHWIGTFTVENNPIPTTITSYVKTHLPNRRNHKIYFDHGTVDLDGKYAPFQKQIDSIMVAKKFKPKKWITKVFEGESHNEKAWAKRLETPIVFLIGKK